MGILDFDFGDAKQKIEDFIDDTKDSVRDIMSEYLGENFLSNNIFGEGKMTTGEDQPGQAVDSQVGSYGKQKFEKLANEYKDMWHRRYEQIQAVHRGMFERPTSHDIYKATHQGEPAYHNSRTVNYTAVTLWTGLFRDTITDAFESGGNEVLELTHLLMTAGFRLNLSEMPSGAGGMNFYEEIFMPWFEDQEIVAKEELFEFDDQARIKRMMREMFEEGPVEDIKQLLNNLDAEI